MPSQEKTALVVDMPAIYARSVFLVILCLFIFCLVTVIPATPPSFKDTETCRLLASGDLYICTDADGNVAYRPAIHPPKK